MQINFIRCKKQKKYLGGNMSQIVEFKLDSGRGISIELEEENVDGIEEISRGSGVIAQAKITFQEALESIKPALDVLTEHLSDINNPAEICVEFGLKFSAKTGVLIASVDSEVSFKVSLKWKKNES
jgi:predicted RNase H-like HicB family nuclease